MTEYTIEDHYNTELRRHTYIMRYGGYSMEVPSWKGSVPLLHMQMAMNRLKAAYDNREFYIPPVQITNKEILK